MIAQLNVLQKRFMVNIKNPTLRFNVAVRMAGKMIGLLIVLMLMTTFIPRAAHAAGLADGPTPEINAINTAWTLIAAFLVFCMQVGFEMLEAGFARSREAVNILAEGIADTCICGVTFWAWGFAFMFMSGTPFIGTSGFFLQGLPETYGSTGIPVLAFWVFQFAFADTCSTITSGAMIGRTGFIGDLLYSVGVTGFIYPIIGHWAWGPDGWLAVMQPLAFRDFAGSTVVHTIGGAISLTGAIVLGPRLGRVFKRDGGGPMPPHNVIMGAVGGLILWVGWYGFNPRRTPSAMEIPGIGRVSLDTTVVISGLFYGGGVTQLVAQVIGSGVTTIATLVISFALMYAVNLTGTLRLDAEGEIQGMDLNEHGVLAYPEYVLNPDDGTPKSIEDVKKMPGRAARAVGD